MKFHRDGTAPSGWNTIFVYGANLAGIHGAGAALHAARHYGALYGCGRPGVVGRSYAIPTKDENLQTLPLAYIEKYVGQFLVAAAERPARPFFVTRIGCGLAGYRDADIAPMFKGAPDNCSFAEEWKPWL